MADFLSRIAPGDLADPGVGFENHSEGVEDLRELRGRINRAEKLLQLRGARIREDEKLIIVTTLMTTAQGEAETSFRIGR